MRPSIQNKTEQFLSEKRRRRRWLSVILSVCLIVALVATHVMSTSGLALTEDETVQETYQVQPEEVQEETAAVTSAQETEAPQVTSETSQVEPAVQTAEG